jgi:exodeoxyribonuclease VII large subunit
MQLLRLLSPRRIVDANRQQIDGLTNRLDRATRRILDRQHTRLAVARAGLSAFSPTATLARGFAIVRDTDGQVIRSVVQARSGDDITIQVKDGTFGARVDG